METGETIQNQNSNVKDCDLSHVAEQASVLSSRTYGFQPGKSGNPAGRPKNIGSTIKEWWNIMSAWNNGQLRAVVAPGRRGKPNLEPIAKKIAARRLMAAQAARGGREDTRLIMEHTDGRPSQQVIHSGDPDNPILIDTLRDKLVRLLMTRTVEDLGLIGVDPRCQVSDGPLEITVDRLRDEGKSDVNPIDSTQP